MKLIKRLIALSTVFMMIAVIFSPTCMADSIYDEHPVDDVEFWTEYYKDNPDMANRYKIKGGFGRYIYDRANEEMIMSDDHKPFNLDYPIGYSVYNEDGCLELDTVFYPVIPNPPELYFSAIPMDYQNKWWRRTLADTDVPELYAGLRTDALHEDKKYLAGEWFRDTIDSTRAIEAMWQLEGDATYDPIHFDDKYRSKVFRLGYVYDIRIVSKDFWPIDYIEQTFMVPDYSKAKLENQLYYKENLDIDGFFSIFSDDRKYQGEQLTGRQEINYYETTLAGKRTFVREVNTNDDWIYYNDYDYHGGYTHDEKGKYIDLSYDTYRDIEIRSSLIVKDYYVIEDLEGLPGYYYCIHIHTKDWTEEVFNASGEGYIVPEIAQIDGEYARLKPIVTEQLVNELASLKPTVSFTPPSENGNPNVQNATADAEKNPGEDKGVSINKGILDDDDSDTAGAVGGAAAVGVGVGVGVGVAGVNSKKKKKKKKEEEKKKTSYKMYVYKDFGDSIQRKAKPVRVCARIARVEDGKEYDDSHLTSYIHPSVNGLVLESYGMSGRYMAAEVSADENAGNSGSVTFTLRTETGIFNRQIIFHIVSDPYIHFVDENADGTLTPMGNSASFGAILGDKFEYSLQFYLHDAVEEPIRFNTQSENNNFEIRIEPTDKLYLYRAIFKNRTNEPERNEIFTKILKEVQNIVAVFKNGYEAECYAMANLFPGGLSVRAEHVEDNRIPVKCYEMEKWNHERFSGEKFWLTLAVKTDKGAKILSPLEDGVDMNIGKKLSGDTRLNDPDSDKVAEKYTYKIDPDVDGQFYFIPKDYLYQPEKDTLYGAVLDASCTYKGVRYERYIPFRLIGAPPDPMGNWEEEYKRAKRIIEKFSLPGEKTKWVLMLEDRSTDPRCSVAELRLFNKHILDKYMTYWTKQNEEDLQKVAYYDNIINTLEWAKFFGDCAFSYLMTVFTGPVAEAIITPSKDIFVYCLGEYIAYINRGESFDYKNLEIVKSLDTAGDNVAAYITTEGVKKNLGMALANIKKMAYYIAGYYVVTVFRNYTAKYLEKGESDWYGAILSAFKDLTANAFKIIAGELFMKWINSKSFQEKVGKALQTWLTDKFRIRFKHTYKVKLNTYDVNISKKGVTVTELPDKLTLKTKIDIKSPNKTTNVEAFQKYLTELCGVGVGYVFDQTSAKIKGEIAANRLYMSATGPKYCFCIWDNGITEPIYCELDLFKAVTYSANPMGPFMFLFDSLFGKLTGAPSAVEFPKDPPYSKTYMENKRSQEQAAASYRKMFDEKVSYPDSDSFGNYGSFGDTGSSGDYDNSGGMGDLADDARQLFDASDTD